MWIGCHVSQWRKCHAPSTSQFSLPPSTWVAVSQLSLGRWGECLQQGGEFPHTGSGELLHVLRGECLHVIEGHAATQSPPNPISRNTTTYIYVNIFKATFQVRQKYRFSILKDCKAATSTIQQYSMLYTDTMSLNHPDIKVGKNCL